MILFAHRGASGYLKENTLSSLKKAVEMGAKAYEIDVQLTKDNKIVVHHDYSLGRIFKGEGYIKDLTENYLHEISKGELPTLKEIINILPKDSFFNIELKIENSDIREIEDYVFEEIKDYPEENILISSFNHEILKRVYKKNNKLKIGLLFDEVPNNLEEYIEKVGIKPYSINPNIKKFSIEKSRIIKRNNLKIFTYTVNEEIDYKKAIELEVDGIFTDYIDRF